MAAQAQAPAQRPPEPRLTSVPRKAACRRPGSAVLPSGTGIGTGPGPAGRGGRSGRSGGRSAQPTCAGPGALCLPRPQAGQRRAFLKFRSDPLLPLRSQPEPPGPAARSRSWARGASHRGPLTTTVPSDLGTRPSRALRLPASRPPSPRPAPCPPRVRPAASRDTPPAGPSRERPPVAHRSLQGSPGHRRPQPGKLGFREPPGAPKGAAFLEGARGAWRGRPWAVGWGPVPPRDRQK